MDWLLSSSTELAQAFRYTLPSGFGRELVTPVLRVYLTMPTHRVVRRHFEVTKRSSDDAIAAEADRHPVFSLTPVS
jgi:hypothetical protein